MNLQNSIMKLQGEQTQIMASFGLNQAKLAKYANQLGPFMQELIFSSDIKLEDVKQSLQLKIEFLSVHGERVIEALIELSNTLNMQEKQFIPLFLNIIISDEAFEHEPNLDREEFDTAYCNSLVI